MGHAFIAEALVTFFVVTAVLEIKSNANCSPAAVGLAYILANLFLFPIDGCSVNPARSFAPAVVGSLHGSHDDSVSDTDKFWTNHWIFWIGPIVGAIIAAVWRKLTGDSSAEAEPPAAADEVESELEKVAGSRLRTAGCCLLRTSGCCLAACPACASGRPRASSCA